MLWLRDWHHFHQTRKQWRGSHWQNIWLILVRNHGLLTKVSCFCVIRSDITPSQRHPLHSPNELLRVARLLSHHALHRSVLLGVGSYPVLVHSGRVVLVLAWEWWWLFCGYMPRACLLEWQYWVCSLVGLQQCRLVIFKRPGDIQVEFFAADAHICNDHICYYFDDGCV